MNREILGYYLSLAAGLCMLAFTLLFGRFLHPIGGVLFVFVVGGALLTQNRNRRLRVLGGSLVICFSVLWWFTVIGGFILPTPTFFSNVRSPLGWITAVPMLLGTLGGSVTIFSSI